MGSASLLASGSASVAVVTAVTSVAVVAAVAAAEVRPSCDAVPPAASSVSLHISGQIE